MPHFIHNKINSLKWNQDILITLLSSDDIENTNMLTLLIIKLIINYQYVTIPNLFEINISFLLDEKYKNAKNKIIREFAKE